MLVKGVQLLVDPYAAFCLMTIRRTICIIARFYALCSLALKKTLCYSVCLMNVLLRFSWALKHCLSPAV